MDRDDVIDVLNTLIEVTKDGEYGFAACAEYARSPALRALLQRRADDCGQAARELQEAVQRHGGIPEVNAAVASALHRGWVAAHSRLAGYRDEAILEECERGEDLALRQYADAITNPLPADVHAMVQRHLEGVSRTHDQIRRLRDELPA
jgi:uncharacterized protein (TIGR02284 family)